MDGIKSYGSSRVFLPVKSVASIVEIFGDMLFWFVCACVCVCVWAREFLLPSGQIP